MSIENRQHFEKTRKKLLLDEERCRILGGVAGVERQRSPQVG